MRRSLLLIASVLGSAWLCAAQQTTFTPICAGTNDTAKFTAIITEIGANAGTIRLPYKISTAGSRCAVNNLTIPVNVTLDNSDGTGIKVNTGQTLTVVGPVISPPKLFFFNATAGLGTVSFSGNTSLGDIPPKWWGAVGNGVADDTVAIRATIDACLSAGGGVVFFPPGTYKVTGLTVTGNNVALIGSGAASRIAMASATGDTISITPRSGYSEYVQVKSLRFTPLVARTSGSEISAPKFGVLLLKDLQFVQEAFQFYRIFDIGSAANQSFIPRIENIRAYGFYQFLRMTRTLAAWVTNCAIDSNRLDSISFHLDGGNEGFTFSNIDSVSSAFQSGTVTGYNVHIKQTNYLGSPTRYGKFTNFYFDSHAYGLFIEDGEDISCVECWGSAPVGNGIRVIGNSTDIRIIGGDMYNCGSNGIYISNSGRTLIQGTSLVGNNQKGAGRGSPNSAGLVLDQPSGGTTRVLGVLSTNMSPGVGVQHYGIWIANNAGSKFVVKDSDFAGNATGPKNNLAGTSAVRIYADNIE